MTKGVKLPTTIHHACSLVASEHEANLTAIIRRWTIQIQIFGKLYLDYEVNTFRIQKCNSSLEDSVKIIKIVWWPIRLIGFRLDFCSSPTSSSGQPRYTPSQSLYDPIFLDPILDSLPLRTRGRLTLNNTISPKKWRLSPATVIICQNASKWQNDICLALGQICL